MPGCIQRSGVPLLRIVQAYCRQNTAQSIHTSQVIYQGGRSQFRLVEVGKFEAPLLYGEYETGQLFYHKVFGYRGIILFPWQAKVFDKNVSIPESSSSKPVRPISKGGGAAPNLVNGEKVSKPQRAAAAGAAEGAAAGNKPSSTDGAGSGPTPTASPPAPAAPSSLSSEMKTQNFYIVLMDSRDQGSVRVRTKSTPVTLDEIENYLITVEGVDNVSHDDIQPYVGTIKSHHKPIRHTFFSEFFLHRQEVEEPPQCIPTDALWACRETILPALRVSNVYRETTENVCVTVTPFYIGARSTTVSERTKSSIYQLQSSRRVKEYWWQYCIRLENVGEEPVQLRERKWCIYTKKMNTINGRGVVGEEPVLSKEEPAFQYVSNISLDSPTGNMWGKYKMEKLHSGAFFDCEIPHFTLESKYNEEVSPPL